MLEEAPAEPETQTVSAHVSETDEGPTPHILNFLKRIERPQGEMGWARKNQRPEGAGSNDMLLVAGAGFEPATSGL